MKRYLTILAAALSLVITSCIQETVPGENFVTDDQLASSEIGVKGLMNAVYTSLAATNPFGDGNMSYGAMSMPALVICEKIASVGRVLRPAEIQDLIEKCC